MSHRQTPTWLKYTTMVVLGASLTTVFLPLLTNSFPVNISFDVSNSTTPFSTFFETLAAVQATVLAIIFAIAVLRLELTAERYTPFALSVFRRDLYFNIVIILFTISIILDIVFSLVVSFTNSTVLIALMLGVAIVLLVTSFLSIIINKNKMFDVISPEMISNHIQEVVSFKTFVRYHEQVQKNGYVDSNEYVEAIEVGRNAIRNDQRRTVLVIINGIGAAFNNVIHQCTDECGLILSQDTETETPQDRDINGQDLEECNNPRREGADPQIQPGDLNSIFRGPTQDFADVGKMALNNGYVDSASLTGNWLGRHTINALSQGVPFIPTTTMNSLSDFTKYVTEIDPTSVDYWHIFDPVFENAIRTESHDVLKIALTRTNIVVEELTATEAMSPSQSELAREIIGYEFAAWRKEIESELSRGQIPTNRTTHKIFDEVLVDFLGQYIYYHHMISAFPTPEVSNQITEELVDTCESTLSTNNDELIIRHLRILIEFCLGLRYDTQIRNFTLEQITKLYSHPVCEEDHIAQAIAGLYQYDDNFERVLPPQALAGYDDESEVISAARSFESHLESRLSS